MKKKRKPVTNFIERNKKNIRAMSAEIKNRQPRIRANLNLKGVPVANNANRTFRKL